MTVKAALIAPAGEESSLGLFSARVSYEAGKSLNNGVSTGGMDRALTEVFNPLVNAVSSKLPK